MYSGHCCTHVEGFEGVNRWLSSALQNISGVNGYRNTWHLTMSIMTDNSNISIVDIGVSENVPTDTPEPWTTTMYICLFIGGFWCGAMTFLMILVVNMYWEQRGARQYQGRPWPPCHSGQNGAAPWQVNLLEEEGRSPRMTTLGQAAHPLGTLCTRR